MKNEYHIFDSQNLLSNETSLKMAKKVSWKYHKSLEMHHKNAIKKQKRSFLNAEKANKKQKKALISY